MASTKPKPIILTTLNAKYHHCSLALRYLKANLEELQEHTHIVEHTIQEAPLQIVESLLEQEPSIIGFSIYIWNIKQSRECIEILKRVRPDIPIIIGGPEVSYELESEPLTNIADVTVAQEGDKVLAPLCRQLLRGETPERFILGGRPEISTVEFPYHLYSDHDLKQRTVYLETSRGCPFTCQFCLSALDKKVRYFDLELMLTTLQELYQRGLRQYKFVDRTFNLKPKIGAEILDFFLNLNDADIFLHFEVVPDLLPDILKEKLSLFKPGQIQLEIGIQSLTDDVMDRIDRRLHREKITKNLSFLRQATCCHLHTDLIVGLPGETLSSFADSFDALYALEPHEIQVGILKRLKGAPIINQEQEWEYIFNRSAPYEVLQNKTMSFDDLKTMRRFSRFWDILANSGEFAQSLRYLLAQSQSPFYGFLALSQYCYAYFQRTHSINRDAQAEMLYCYGVHQLNFDPGTWAQSLRQDYMQGVRRMPPKFLKKYPEIPQSLKKLSETEKQKLRDQQSPKKDATPKRQQTHLSGA